MREKHKFPLHFSLSEISKNYIRFLSGKMCTLSKPSANKISHTVRMHEQAGEIFPEMLWFRTLFHRRAMDFWATSD